MKKCLTIQCTTAQPMEAVKKLTLPYIIYLSETIDRLLQPHGTTVAHKLTEALQNILSNPRDSAAQEEKKKNHLQHTL